MAKTPIDYLLRSLEELVPYDFEKFKFKLQNTSLEKEQQRIPRGLLPSARPVKLASLLLSYYGEKCAVQLTLQVLRAMNQHLLAEELHRATDPEYLIQESGTDCPATCSSGESKPKSLKMPNGLEGDRQQQSGDGAASQPEAGKGPQKKPQGKRRDQKGSEGLDVQGKPGARGVTLCSRRSTLLSKQPGEKGSESSEEVKSENLDSAATPSKVATLDVGATMAVEKGSRNPEHSVIMDRGTLRNTLSNVLLDGKEKTWEHSEYTALLEKNRIEDPETPKTLGEAVGSELSNPEVPPSSGRPQEEAVCPLSRAQEGDLVGSTCVHDSWSCSIASKDPKASDGCLPSCLRCQVSLPGKCSGGIEPQEGPSMGSLSPTPQPQCTRHRKQVQLLFCEDHREPICLICSLSQEHRGHRVRPIEEAALEYKEQIQKELEHLKALRSSGEEQRSEGDKNTANYLKQTEIQKQRVRCQMEQFCQFLEQQERLFVAWLEKLAQTIVQKQTEIQKQRVRCQMEQFCQFLEQQERLFVAWLEKLAQTIVQVRETYDTKVSRDIALLTELIEELETKQCQPEWELMQDIGVTLRRVKTVTAPEPWATPLEVKEKIHLLLQKSEFVEKSMKHFSGTLCSEMETFNVPELIDAQTHAVNVILDAETAHPNLIISDDLKSARLGNKWIHMPDSPERFDSCIFALGSPSFRSGCHYWEVEVGDKTGWVLGICKASTSRKGNMTLSPENGYWVVMMMKRNEYQASTFPPTRLRMREPPRRVGIFLDYKAGDISFYNVTAKSHIYTFTSFSFSGPLQAIFSPGTHDGGKNMDPLTICPVGDQGPH
ncbi:Pyrin [Myotis davidii]|uniref:Pyrin n=1 Tax=Myotis davidii TaxID=225400 RepID=L5MDS4_MYODS|nr:Pyrin [Myotis davidii]